MSNEEYTQIDKPDGVRLELCPCCGSTPGLWQFVTKTGDEQKVVMCTNGEAFGPQDGMAHAGCPLYMPNDGFYRATIREAAGKVRDGT